MEKCSTFNIKLVLTAVAFSNYADIFF